MNKASSEDQWSELETLWKQQRVSTKVPTAILKWVRRQERRMRFVIISEVITWIVLALFIVKTVLERNLADVSIRLFFVFSIFALGIGFSIVNRRGLWGPLEETAKAYIDLALLRLRRKRREINFCWFYLLIQLVIFAVWHFISIEIDPNAPFIKDPQKALLVTLGVTAFLSLHSYYVYWRTGREKASLEDLQKKYLN
ncbi:hypothetical protein [Microbulbifer sp. TRSA005]|uniref:hypothetical protein n=1 Tax=Microbulbifer sp. TRSA005 TaxID=3243383 RepID=UPI004039E1AA